MECLVRVVDTWESRDTCKSRDTYGGGGGGGGWGGGL